MADLLNSAYIYFLLVLCVACSNNEQSSGQEPKKTAHGEYLYRLHDERFFVPPLPEKRNVEPYPWEKTLVGNLPKLTKDYFRCKGSVLNPPKATQNNKEVIRYMDCGGTDKHSLPLRDGKEFIYPILIDVLNYIQLKTSKRVVITSGHRCPDHNVYVNDAPSNQHSKHMIGAEVSFYVQGLEEKPETCVKLVQDYYKEKYEGKNEFVEFKRYEKGDTDVATQPWYNKELFVKLYSKKEGRDFDNRHPYPYLSLQVRYDLERNERVVFSWEKAHKNYFRK